MLIVKIEMHSARTGLVSEIGRMVIEHDEDVSDPEVGNYNVFVCREGRYAASHVDPWRTGRVEKYARLRNHIWKLVLRSILSAFPEEARREPVDDGFQKEPL